MVSYKYVAIYSTRKCSIETVIESSNRKGFDTKKCIDIGLVYHVFLTKALGDKEDKGNPTFCNTSIEINI